MIRILENLNANIVAVTKSGLNVLHMAAQSDALDSFIHFYTKIDINSTDNKGMTPLHWAAYLSSEKVASLLMSLNCNLDAEDDNK
jgi:ankyrin repeat protein